MIADANDYTTEVEATLSLSQIVQRINPTYSGDFNYWYYDGSLSTPECNETVRWIVTEKPLHVTDDQVSICLIFYKMLCIQFMYLYFSCLPYLV